MYMKDLHLQFRGLCYAYDEAFTIGDMELSAAIWRNIFNAAANANVKNIVSTVEHVRKTLSILDSLTDKSFLSAEFEI